MGRGEKKVQRGMEDGPICREKSEIKLDQIVCNYVTQAPFTFSSPNCHYRTVQTLSFQMYLFPIYYSFLHSESQPDKCSILGCYHGILL